MRPADLTHIGGLGTLLGLLGSGHPELRAAAAEVVATCVQNNPPVQQLFLEGGALPRLLALFADPDPTCRCGPGAAFVPFQILWLRLHMGAVPPEPPAARSLRGTRCPRYTAAWGCVVQELVCIWGQDQDCAWKAETSILTVEYLRVQVGCNLQPCALGHQAQVVTAALTAPSHPCVCHPRSQSCCDPSLNPCLPVAPCM